jgi:hypothetical protein
MRNFPQYVVPLINFRPGVRGQNPKLSSNELESGSWNTVGGGFLPTADLTPAWRPDMGRSATTSELRRLSSFRGFTSPPSPGTKPMPDAGNSQLRTVDG